MTTYVAVIYQFNHPTMKINLGKYAHFVESNSRANAKKKFIELNGKNIKRTGDRYPVEIFSIPEYIRDWEHHHSSYVTEGYQLVSNNGGKSWAVSSKNARHDKSDIKHAALEDVGTGNSYIHTVPRYK